MRAVDGLAQDASEKSAHRHNPTDMVAEHQFSGAVQDDLDWLDKNRLTDNDEFIDAPVLQNQEEV